MPEPSIRRVSIVRTETDSLGTFGHLVVSPAFECWSGELPWLGNSKGKSCIPDGVYRCEWGMSPKFGGTYHVRAVPGRDSILIHAGNFVGDEDKNLKANSDGCILLGRAIGDIAGQKALLSSKDALAAFVEEMDKEPFELSIIWAHGVRP